MSRFKQLPIIEGGRDTGRTRTVQDVIQRGAFEIKCSPGEKAHKKPVPNRFHATTRARLGAVRETVIHTYCEAPEPDEQKNESKVKVTGKRKACAGTSRFATAHSVSASIKPITGYVDLQSADRTISSQEMTGQFSMHYHGIDTIPFRSSPLAQSSAWPLDSSPQREVLICFELQGLAQESEFELAITSEATTRMTEAT